MPMLKNRMSLRGYVIVLAIQFFCFFTPILFSADSAVIIMYHRFGDERYPSTNIRLDQLDKQIQELKTGGYHVLPLPEIVAQLQQGKALPDKTVGITIDDAYETVYTYAWPRFKKAGFPFTLFVETDPIDKNYKDMMTWKQIQELVANGVTIGNHTASHPYLENLSVDQAKSDILKAQQRLTKELGQAPTLFAYPYGEYNLAVIDMVKKLRFIAAFIQISGPIGSQSDFFLLSRFSLNENYGTLDRFKIILNTYPLLISDLSARDPIIKKNNSPLIIQFSVSNPKLNLSQLKCYATDIGRLQVKVFEKQKVEVTSEKYFSKGRTHVNCTLLRKEGGYYWGGLLYIKTF